MGFGNDANSTQRRLYRVHYNRNWASIIQMADDNTLASRATKSVVALRESSASLTHVPNTVRQSIADVIEEQAEAMERVYGLLWRGITDSPHVHEARKFLFVLLGPNGQRRGIEWVGKTHAPVSDVEIKERTIR